MSGRHAGQSATRKRMFRVAAVSAVALPLGMAVAGSASAATLPVDTNSVSDLLGSASGASPLSAVGGITGAVTGVLGNSSPLSAVTSDASPVSALTSDSPVAAVTGLLGDSSPVSAVTGVLGGSSPVSGVTSDLSGADASPVSGVTGLLGGSSPVSGLLGGSSPVSGLTHNLPVVGGLVGSSAGLGGVVGGLGLGSTLGTVTGTLGGLTGTLGGLTGTLGGVLNPILGGGLLGGLLGGSNTDLPGHGDAGHEHEPVIETSTLPHTGGDQNMTALLLCSGLGLAGSGVTLVTRRRRSMAL